MFARQILILFLVVATAEKLSAQTLPLPLLQPVNPWVLNYATTECVAERQYGDPANPVLLAVRASVAGEVYEILVGRAGSAPRFAEHRDGSIDFGQGPIEAGLLQYAAKDKKLILQKFRLTGSVIGQAKKATSVRFTVKDGPDARFVLRAMPALFKGLDDCTANLRAYWNGDGKPGIIVTPAKGDIRHLFSSDDYPAEAIRRDQQGTAQFMLLIDEKGKAAGCDILVPSGVPALDAMGCQVIRERLKLKPALDKSGKPVRSTIVTPPVTWRMRG